jgi:hypothetical protein
MTTTCELQREKIRAVLDKRALAQAMAVVVKTLLVSVRAEKDDFWVYTDLDVHIQEGKTLEKNARINVSDGVALENCGRSTATVTPLQLRQTKIEAVLDEKSLALAMSWVVKTLLTAVQKEQEDFWVNIHFNVHLQRGIALEKRAKINVYGDLVDSYGTTIADTIDDNEIPSQIFRAFCEHLEDSSTY